MSDSIIIRKARVEDAANISALILSLSDYLNVKEHEPVPFYDRVSHAAIAANLQNSSFDYYVAESGGHLAGVIGIRDRSHLFHLFVSREYHRRGIATRLWETALAESLDTKEHDRITVNSSDFGVPLYERLGFRIVGERVEKDGVAFIPMELRPGAQCT